MEHGWTFILTFYADDILLFGLDKYVEGYQICMVLTVLFEHEHPFHIATPSYPIISNQTKNIYEVNVDKTVGYLLKSTCAPMCKAAISISAAI